MSTGGIMYVSHAKFTCSEDISLWWYCPLNIYEKAYFLWWPPFLQHFLVVVIQQSGYLIFHDRDISIWLGLLWQSSPTLLLSVSHYWNLHSEQYCQSRKWWTLFISILFLYFYFIFNLSFIFLFLELRVRVRVMRSCCHTAGHIR